MRSLLNFSIADFKRSKRKDGNTLTSQVICIIDVTVKLSADLACI